MVRIDSFLLSFSSIATLAGHSIEPNLNDTLRISWTKKEVSDSY
jgi:hypothetical protein